MFCRNCANQLDEQAAVCISCGAPKGTGTAYCSNCATPTNPGAAICTNCGMALTAVSSDEQKSKMLCGLMAIFFGWLGVHNFMLGYTSKAVIQLIMGIVGFCLGGIGSFMFFGLFLLPIGFAAWIWGLVEGIFIFTGKINTDAKGNPLKD